MRTNVKKTIGEILVGRFGKDVCIDKAADLLEQYNHSRYSEENSYWEHLRGSTKTKEFKKYNACDSYRRERMCLDDSEYARNAIICAALDAYIQSLSSPELKTSGFPAAHSMNWLEFQVKYNYHNINRCCNNCKHEEDYDDEFCKCHHPIVEENGFNLASYDGICDLWEKKEGK